MVASMFGKICHELVCKSIEMNMDFNQVRFVLE